MTNQTIDGVPGLRALLQRIADGGYCKEHVMAELRALLNAPAKRVEAPKPVAYLFTQPGCRDFLEKYNSPECYFRDPENWKCEPLVKLSDVQLGQPEQAASFYAIPCRKFPNAEQRPSCRSDCPCGTSPVAVVPKTECPNCLGDRMLRCDACIPDFSPGSGNKARRRAEALQKGCTQPQAHPARCGCERGDHE